MRERDRMKEKGRGEVHKVEEMQLDTLLTRFWKNEQILRTLPKLSPSSDTLYYARPWFFTLLLHRLEIKNEFHRALKGPCGTFSCEKPHKTGCCSRNSHYSITATAHICMGGDEKKTLRDFKVSVNMSLCLYGYYIERK